ncbi:sporulation protein YqfC [Hydrogenispora ethanolica]|uniref:Sporulation protein YqfC n=1 Tax=Hydrogenispora ethanolica TaxID=1082276 RepID=A0A4V2QDU8_HYDET|nr:YabP/YqfC family sporulation protein [Hydrogenispora ethanolica]TCL65297.1 sporulation protein YqfC [Hydrogenispora ethanolica]
MPEKKSPIGHKLMEFLDIPLDTVADWPRIVLSANRSAIIENHRGVIEYDTRVVRVNTKLGELRIAGENLTLVSAVKDEVIIQGRIAQLDLVDWR